MLKGANEPDHLHSQTHTQLLTVKAIYNRKATKSIVSPNTYPDFRQEKEIELKDRPHKGNEYLATNE